MEYPFTNQLLYIKKNVINVLMRNANAEPFKVPVNPESLQIPQYPKIIKHAMDFGTIKNKLEKRRYRSANECKSDFLDVFRNCYVFNEPGCVFVDMALKLENLFHRKLLELPMPEVYASEQSVSSKSSKSKKSKHSSSSNPVSKTQKSIPAQTPLSVTVPPSMYTSTPSLTTKRQRVPSYLDTSNISQNDEPIIKKSKMNTPPSIDIKNCKHIIQNLMSKKYNDLNRYFLQPVDVEGLKLHDYFDIVHKPMDLSTVRSKLFDNCYQTNAEFADDVRLIFRNCYLYNPDSHEVYRCGKMLENVFNKLYQNSVGGNNSGGEGAASSRNVLSNNNSSTKHNRTGNPICYEEVEPLLQKIVARQGEIDNLHREMVRQYQQIQNTMNCINRAQLLNSLRRLDQYQQNDAKATTPSKAVNKNESHPATNQSSISSVVSSNKKHSPLKSSPINNLNHVTSSLSSLKPDNQSSCNYNDEEDDLNSAIDDIPRDVVMDDQKNESAMVVKNDEVAPNQFQQEPSLENSDNGDDKSSVVSDAEKEAEVKLSPKNMNACIEDSSRDSEKVSRTNKSSPINSLDSTHNNISDDKKSQNVSPGAPIFTDESSAISQQPASESVCPVNTVSIEEASLPLKTQQPSPPIKNKIFQSPKHSESFIEEISSVMSKLKPETNMKLREFINRSEKKTIISLNLRSLKPSTIKGVYKLLLKSKEYSDMVEEDLKSFSNDERIQLGNELRQVTDSQSLKIIKILRETEDVDSANEEECEIDFQTMKLITLHRLKAFADRCMQKNKSKSTMESNDDEDSDSGHSDSSDSSGSNALSGSNQNSGSNSDASSSSSSDNELCDEPSQEKTTQPTQLHDPSSSSVTTNNTNSFSSVSLSSSAPQNSILPAQNPTISSTDNMPLNSSVSRLSHNITTPSQMTSQSANKKPTITPSTNQKAAVQSQRLSDSESDSDDDDENKSNSQPHASMSQQSSHMYRRPKYTNLWKNKSAFSSTNTTPNNNPSSQQVSYKLPNSQNRNKVTTPSSAASMTANTQASSTQASSSSIPHPPEKKDPNKLHESLKQIFQDAQAHENVKKQEEELRLFRMKEEEKMKQKQLQTMHAFQESKKKQQHNEYQRKLHEQNRKEEKVKSDMKKRHLDIPALPEREDNHQLLCDFEYYMNRDLLMRLAHSKSSQFHI